MQSVIGAARLKVEDIKIKGDIYRPLFLALIKITGLFVNCART
ncbi:hypothetical protein BFV94_0021 [Alteromonas macleodii]|uniref:Uncharacterized protein n=1 Tax=Alteromonas macleodii TaxID=28108 RepID=A0AB36FXR7_ALTMA|nr:hypothetical protein BFV94_0021 [Alteromonas macleodii]OES38366.1 hypothetical protein BFV93_0021 [Alteromonas macleodii]OES38410.1 hypothetical protein BFV95_0021 [Alteromonas macleodii]OES43328.1 hypothetical protein BFV96_0021 [Alteromonas macleodii]